MQPWGHVQLVGTGGAAISGYRFRFCEVCPLLSWWGGLISNSADATKRLKKCWDSIVNIHRRIINECRPQIVGEWSRPYTYLTEADFVPAGEGNATSREDDGYLISISYTQGSNNSQVLILDAKSFELVKLLGGKIRTYFEVMPFCCMWIHMILKTSSHLTLTGYHA